VSTDAYLDARAAFSETDKAISNLASKFEIVGQELKHRRQRFHFSNVPGAFPAEVIISHTAATDGSSWPSPTDVNATLIKWHSNREAMMLAWDAIPANRRAGLVSPPEDRR
jgi:hypothetical protein